MAEVKIVDARGLSCPLPVVETRRAMATGATALEILVDNATAKANVTRCGRSCGWTLEKALEDPDGTIRLSFVK